MIIEQAFLALPELLLGNHYEPRYYLPYQDRPWVKALHDAGRQEIFLDNLAVESNTAKNQFGHGLQDMQIQATVTNLVNSPIEVDAAWNLRAATPENPLAPPRIREPASRPTTLPCGN